MKQSDEWVRRVPVRRSEKRGQVTHFPTDDWDDGDRMNDWQEMSNQSPFFTSANRDGS